MRRINFGFGFWFGLVIIGGTVGIFWWMIASQTAKERKQQEMTSREAALICTTDMATTYHIHPQLAIMINGKEEPIPMNIGIKPNCMNAIHTHDEVGTLHVESPIQKDFTLGDFFAVWQKDFSKGKILEYAAGPNATITVTVNGEPVDTYENTILKDKDKIVISYQNN